MLQILLSMWYFYLKARLLGINIKFSTIACGSSTFLSLILIISYFPEIVSLNLSTVSIRIIPSFSQAFSKSSSTEIKFLIP